MSEHSYHGATSYFELNGSKEMFYIPKFSTHFIYRYMASDM